MLQFLDEIDRTVLLWVHKNQFPLFNKFMPFITDAGNWIIPILLLFLLLGFMTDKRGKITLAMLIIAVGLTDSICAQILKPFFERIRPSHMNLDNLNLLVPKGGKWSMPSNHAANVFAFGVILSYFFERTKLPLFSLAFIIAFSRIYIGVHYPGDVIVGSIFGYIMGWVILTFWVILKIRELKRGQTWVWYEGPPTK
ncbi:MAG: hypothetical protein CMG74_01480 [Candidatus Marinimicrobia bacterium]|nr:hypothetical protein [Candidatus Neomarinimicrobiota bacterium]|tara:strand:+ start:28940 stop:29530 length:591 start_codon:yes stop_codon:yes gene_type:complete